VKLLLDQDFPLALCRALRGAGMEVEHVTSILGRGVSDDVLRARLGAEGLVLLTHDMEFDDIPADLPSRVVISHLPQYRPIEERVGAWCAAINALAERRPPERLFEILPWGELVAWEIVELGRQLRRLV
jgi:hypothetical protein